MSAWNNRFPEAVAALEQLQKNYPQSGRHRHTEKWIKYFKQKIETGGTYP
jgi:hypothetical protein